MVTTVKVSAQIQDGWRNDAEIIRKLKNIVANFDVPLESAYSFITHFSQ